MMTKEILATLLDRPIAFHRAFVGLCGGVAGAVWLSQLVYWSKRGVDPDGWIYKEQAEWQEETGLGRSEQERVRRILRGNGILEEKFQGIPRTLFYRLNFDKLAEALSSQARRKTAGTRAGQRSSHNAEIQHYAMPKTSSIECRNPAVLNAEKQHSIYIDYHQRIPTEIKTTTTLSANEPPEVVDDETLEEAIEAARWEAQQGGTAIRNVASWAHALETRIRASGLTSADRLAIQRRRQWMHKQADDAARKVAALEDERQRDAARANESARRAMAEAVLAAMPDDEADALALRATEQNPTLRKAFARGGRSNPQVRAAVVRQLMEDGEGSFSGTSLQGKDGGEMRGEGNRE